MVEKKSPADICMLAVIYTAVTIVSIICLYPMIHVLMASFSDPRMLTNHRGLLLWPTGFSFRGYVSVLNNPNIWSGYTNTLIYVIAGTALSMILTTMGAYAFSVQGYPLRRVLMFLCVFTMYFGGGIVANFLVVKGLGLYNSRLALIIPGAIGTWNMIVMRTAFSGVPKELSESAYLDGANDFTIMLRIYVPICRANIATIILFYAVGNWNSWFNAVLYLRDSSKYPLQLILRDILINEGAAGIVDDADAIYMKELLKYSTIMVSTLPILMIYPFVQRFFMKGVMMGSLKG